MHQICIEGEKGEGNQIMGNGFILLSAPWLELWTHQQQIVKWRNQGVLKFIFAPNVSFGVWNFLWAINIVEQFLQSFWWRETSLGRGTTLEYSSGRLHTDFFIFYSWHLKNFILVNKDVEHNWFYEARGETPHFQSCHFLKKKDLAKNFHIHRIQSSHILEIPLTPFFTTNHLSAIEFDTNWNSWESTVIAKNSLFLAVQDSLIGDLVSQWVSETDFWFQRH